MSFNSFVFLCIFLPGMVIGYFLLPKKMKNFYLLIGSILFYIWGDDKGLPVLFFSILFNYIFGLAIYGLRKKEGENGRGAKWIVFLAVLFNLGLLGVYKYTSFILQNFQKLFHTSFNPVEITLPLGISFFTFQGISYVIDVYREEGRQGRSIVQKNLFDFALYIGMFPQLTAGPIIRYHTVREALSNREHTIGKLALGFERFIIGLSKKVILSGTVGEVASKIMESDYTIMGSSLAWLGAVCYTFEIYYDFSGYSDMAIGLGKMFGFDFEENFHYPYISCSITEFWRRWHISLSSWFKDYLYIPLGGNRKGNVYRNLAIVFLATGIWHGAAWGFVIWGMWHGAFMLAERWFRNMKWHIPVVVKWFYTMLVVTFGWVLFRIVDLRQTWHYFKIMFHVSRPEFVGFSVWYYLDAKMICILVICFLSMIPWKQWWKNIDQWEERRGILWIKRIFLLTLLLISMMFLMNGTYSPAIYAQF